MEGNSEEIALREWCIRAVNVLAVVGIIAALSSLLNGWPSFGSWNAHSVLLMSLSLAIVTSRWFRHNVKNFFWY